ncbi:MAG: hypothetical protein AAGA77_26220, partial [Bacteroidota bacterium]
FLFFKNGQQIHKQKNDSMNLDDLGGDARKENILAIMAAMSTADGTFHENEMVYILKLGLSLGMTDEQIRDVTINNNPTLFVPSSEAERMEILVYLVCLIRIDGDITEEEKEMLYHFALKLGFNHLLVSNIIRVLHANKGKRLPPDAILKEVKKYLN